MSYIISFIQALGLTIVIECSIAAALSYFGGPRLRFASSYRRLIATVALASVLTLPYVWFVLIELIHPRPIYEISAEIIVMFVETLFYVLTLKITVKKALILSLCANLGSVLIGKFFF
jgi:hypothetical protein